MKNTVQRIFQTNIPSCSMNTHDFAHWALPVPVFALRKGRNSELWGWDREKLSTREFAMFPRADSAQNRARFSLFLSRRHGSLNILFWSRVTTLFSVQSSYRAHTRNTFHRRYRHPPSTTQLLDTIIFWEVFHSNITSVDPSDEGYSRGATSVAIISLNFCASVH